MELKEFIATSIKQIAEGIRMAQVNCEDPVWVNPVVEGANTESQRYAAVRHSPVHPDKFHFAPINDVQFDVAVTVSDATESDHGGKIRVLGIELGADKTKSAGAEVVSRLSFTVPITLPLSHPSGDF